MRNNWICFAKENNYKYLIIVYDFEDKEEYPVYINSNLESEIKNLNLSIRNQKVVEVIDLQ